MMDWTQLGEVLSVAVVAGGSALLGASRVLRQRLGELLRPVVAEELARGREEDDDARREALRTVVREELAGLLAHLPSRADLEAVNQRLARAEGSLQTLSSMVSARTSTRTPTV